MELQGTRTGLCGRATWRTLGGRLEACQSGEWIKDELEALDLDARFPGFQVMTGIIEC